MLPKTTTVAGLEYGNLIGAPDRQSVRRQQRHEINRTILVTGLRCLTTYQRMTTLSTVADTSDADLVGRSLAGDWRTAFSQIVLRYQNLVCSLAYSVIGNLGQSEDAAQETFIVAWKRLRHLREPSKLRAWLCGIVSNRARDCVHGATDVKLPPGRNRSTLFKKSPRPRRCHQSWPLAKKSRLLCGGRCAGFRKFIASRLSSIIAKTIPWSASPKLSN